MRKMAVLMILVCSAAPAWAERPLRHVLFDFEGGIEGWWGNVYSGAGTCQPRVADEPKFGSGALHCEVRGVEGGSNTVSAWFPADAQWRDYEWGLISFWVMVVTRLSVVGRVFVGVWRASCGEAKALGACGRGAMD